MRPFFDKIKDVNSPEQFLQVKYLVRVSLKSVVNKDVLEKWVGTHKSCTQDGLHLTIDKNVCITVVQI